MKTFVLEVKETLSKTITIEANSMEEALSVAISQYHNAQIVLGHNDNLNTDIDIAELPTAYNHPEFSDFVLQNAEDMIEHLSIEELAKIGFGNLAAAIESFNQNDEF